MAPARTDRLERSFDQFDPFDPVAATAAYVKVRASLAEEDVVCWWKGNVYGYVPGAPHTHLFRCEGFSVGRARPVPGGYEWLSREATFYGDAATGHILEHAPNPFTGRVDEVVHGWNDPVNADIRAVAGEAPVPDLLGDTVAFCADVFPLYPHPLPPARWPEESSGEWYHGAELTRLVAAHADVVGGGPSAPCQLTWVRMTPWLPWMGMGTRPGGLVVHAGGVKLAGGYAGLPAHVRRYVETHRPEFAFAPSRRHAPNEDAWTFYRKLRSGRG